MCKGKQLIDKKEIWGLTMNVDLIPFKILF